jgi:hypothetical protein
VRWPVEWHIPAHDCIPPAGLLHPVEYIAAFLDAVIIQGLNASGLMGGGVMVIPLAMWLVYF